MSDPRIHRVFRVGQHWCVVADNGLAFYVGYVSIPKDHPWHGLHYDTVHELYDVDVHGGLTFADERDWVGWGGDGAPAGWYVGFDFGHAWDAPIAGSHLANVYGRLDGRIGLKEWDDESVAEEVRRLAIWAQSAAMVNA